MESNLVSRRATFRHEIGSPSFKSVTGHTYRILCELAFPQSTAVWTRHSFAARGIAFFDLEPTDAKADQQERNVTKSAEEEEQEQEEQEEQKQGVDASVSTTVLTSVLSANGTQNTLLRYMVLQITDESGAHPAYGAMFACTSAFLLEHATLV
jgi:hypothetical protein